MKNEQFWENSQFPFYTNTVMLQAGEEVAAHSHEFFELAYIVEGSGEHQYNKGEFHPINQVMSSSLSLILNTLTV